MKEGLKYPPLLIATADHDDRVAPAHAYKFAATMQDKAPDNEVYLLVKRGSGHGEHLLSKGLDDSANAIAFFNDKLGGPFLELAEDQRLRLYGRSEPADTSSGLASLSQLAHVPEKWDTGFPKRTCAKSKTRAHSGSIQSGCALARRLSVAGRRPTRRSSRSFDASLTRWAISGCRSINT